MQTCKELSCDNSLLVWKIAEGTLVCPSCGLVYDYSAIDFTLETWVFEGDELQGSNTKVRVAFYDDTDGSGLPVTGPWWSQIIEHQSDEAKLRSRASAMLEEFQYCLNLKPMLVDVTMKYFCEITKMELFRGKELRNVLAGLLVYTSQELKMSIQIKTI